MVFAKNSDRPPDEAQVFLTHTARSAGGLLNTQYLRIDDAGSCAHVASHPTWLWGAEHGVNEHGVAIGNERIWTTDDPRAQRYGLLGMDLVRLGLERGCTADDALAVMTHAITEHGQGGSGEHGYDAPYFSSFLIADARGGWVLETSARTWAARPVGAGSSISNRLTLTTDWTVASDDLERGTNFDAWRSPTIRTSFADHRLAATRACITRRAGGKAAATTADVVATLRDHGNGPWSAASDAAANPVPRSRFDDDRHVTVCMHLTDDQATTASFVAELRADAPRARGRARGARVWACTSRSSHRSCPIFCRIRRSGVGSRTSATVWSPTPARSKRFALSLLQLSPSCGPRPTTPTGPAHEHRRTRSRPGRRNEWTRPSRPWASERLSLRG